MAKGQVKKAQIQKVQKLQAQAENAIFALDIGTRSIIGMVGIVEEDKVRIIAIDKEEHTERALLRSKLRNIPKGLSKEIAEILDDIEGKQL